MHGRTDGHYDRGDLVKLKPGLASFYVTYSVSQIKNPTPRAPDIVSFVSQTVENL